MYQALAVAKHRAARPAVDKILRVDNPRIPGVHKREQPRYAENKECSL